jgi:hypothetical protein
MSAPRSWPSVDERSTSGPVGTPRAPRNQAPTKEEAMTCASMRRITTFISAVALAGLVAAPLASAKPRSVSFVSVVTSVKQSTTQYRSVADLYRGKSKVGQVDYACAMDAKQGTCTGTARALLPEGTLRLRYVYVLAHPARTTITVAGGTGAYGGARGAGTYTPLDSLDTHQAIKLRIR